MADVTKRDLTRDLAAVAMALAGFVLIVWGVIELGWGMLVWVTGISLLGASVWLASRPPRAPRAPDGLAPVDDDNRLEIRPARDADTT